MVMRSGTSLTNPQGVPVSSSNPMPTRATGGGEKVTLLNAVGAAGAGAAQSLAGSRRTFHATGQTTSGAGAVTLKVQGSLVDTPSVDGHWVDIATITLTLGTTVTGDGFVSDAPWPVVRGVVTNISGTGAAVTLLGGA